MFVLNIGKIGARAGRCEQVWTRIEVENRELRRSFGLDEKIQEAGIRQGVSNGKT